MFGTPDSGTAKAVRAVCVDGKTNIPQMLGAVRWDVVTIQQGSVGSPFADTYQPYADNLIATIRKHAPQAEILIQETWAYLPYHKKLGEWKMTQREMYERLHKNYSALAKKTGFRVIPTGTAARISHVLCCLMNETDMQIRMIQITSTVFHTGEASFFRSHTDPMPMEYATCKDGQTPVGVSNRYIKEIIAVRMLSLGMTSGRRSCMDGHKMYVIMANACVTII